MQNNTILFIFRFTFGYLFFNLIYVFFCNTFKKIKFKLL